MPYKFNPITQNLDLVNSAGSSLTVDTRSNIIALSPSSPTNAFSSDTHEYFVWDGTDWYVVDAILTLVGNEFLILETGDYILLETGDKIIKE